MHPRRRSCPRETAPCGRPFPCGLGERVTAAGERAATSRGSHVLSGGKAERHRKARRKTDFPQTRTPRSQAAPSGCPRLCGKWGPLVTTEAPMHSGGFGSGREGSRRGRLLSRCAPALHAKCWRCLCAATTSSRSDTGESDRLRPTCVTAAPRNRHRPAPARALARVAARFPAPRLHPPWVPRRCSTTNASGRSMP